MKNHVAKHRKKAANSSATVLVARYGVGATAVKIKNGTSVKQALTGLRIPRGYEIRVNSVVTTAAKRLKHGDLVVILRKIHGTVGLSHRS